MGGGLGESPDRGGRGQRPGAEPGATAADPSPARRGRGRVRLGVVTATALLAGTAIALVAVDLAGPPAGASSSLAVAAGFGSYAPAALWATPGQPVSTTFDVAGLVTGGDGTVGTVTITSQPASGSATASGQAVVYQPTASTTGTQTVAFSVCDTASPADCGTSTLTLASPTPMTVDFNCPSGLSGTITQAVGVAVQAPATVTPGSTFTATEAAAPTQPPSTMTCSGVSASVQDITSLDAIVPVPAGASYVSGTAALTGGDPNTDAHTVLLLCGSGSKPLAVVPAGGAGTCSAQTGTTNYPSSASGGRWATTDPYFELDTTGIADTPQDTISEPSITASFTVTGAANSTIQPELTELDTDGTASADGFTESAQLYGAPSQPEPLATTTVVSPPPTVTSVAPASGPAAGGTTVTVDGTGLTGATAVDFGTTAASSFSVVSATEVTATAPAGAGGTVDVTVTTPDGTSATSSADRYTYVVAPTVTGVTPSTGGGAGGTTVTVTGTALTGATAVDFGAAPASSFTVDSATQVTAVSPAGPAGPVDVTVTTPGGTSTTSATNTFTYDSPPPAPTVSGVSPSSGPTAGGTTVTVTGTAFTAGTTVAFGGTAASGTRLLSSTQLMVVSPAGPAGPVDVTVTTSGGTSPTSAADTFTYDPPPPPPTVSGVSPSSGPTAGGTAVTVTGSDLAGATAVAFGATAATDVTVVSSTVLHVVSPPAAAGTTDVTVTTAGGTSPTSPADHFTYLAPTAPPPAASTPPAPGPSSSGNPSPGPGAASSGPPAPGAPPHLAAIPADGGALVTWTAPTHTTALAAYLVGLSPACPACTGLLVPPTATTATIVGLPNDTTTTITVAAVTTTDIIGAPATPAPVTPQPGDRCPTTATGTWLTHWDGTITTDTTGTFPTHGSMAGHHLNAAMVGLTFTPGCTGYWQYGADGGVFAFGTAPFLGADHTPSDDPTVAMAATPDGHGYWLADATGTITPHGDATLLPRTSPTPPTGRIATLVPTPDAKGYWLLSTTGAITTYGDATNAGDLPTHHITPDGTIIAMAATPDGHGYWLLSTTGAVYAFGTAPYLGGPNTTNPPTAAAWVAITTTPTGTYQTTSTTGTTWTPTSPPTPSPATTTSPTWTATPI